METRGYLPTYILFFNLKESIVGPQSLALNSKYIHLHFNKSQLQRRHRHPGEFRQRQKSSINIDFLFKAHCRRRRHRQIFSLCRHLGHKNPVEFRPPWDIFAKATLSAAAASFSLLSVMTDITNARARTHRPRDFYELELMRNCSSEQMSPVPRNPSEPRATSATNLTNLSPQSTNVRMDEGFQTTLLRCRF